MWQADGAFNLTLRYSTISVDSGAQIDDTKKTPNLILLPKLLPVIRTVSGTDVSTRLWINF